MTEAMGSGSAETLDQISLPVLVPFFTYDKLEMKNDRLVYG